MVVAAATTVAVGAAGPPTVGAAAVPLGRGGRRGRVWATAWGGVPRGRWGDAAQRAGR